jgi:uncharacterized protein
MIKFDGPLPDPDLPDFAEFWAGCREGRLSVPRCGRGHLFWPPRPVCRTCQTPIADWPEVAGLGRLYSWTVVHRTPLRGFAADTPYIVVIVALDDDPKVRLVGRCTDNSSDLFDGAAMAARFMPVSERVTLVLWRLIDQTGGHEESSAVPVHEARGHPRRLAQSPSPSITRAHGRRSSGGTPANEPLTLPITTGYCILQTHLEDTDLWTTEKNLPEIREHSKESYPASAAARLATTTADCRPTTWRCAANEH